MPCVGCNGQTNPNMWGEWCDACGGVVVHSRRLLEGGIVEIVPHLIFRHVATVGCQGRYYPIVFDASAGMHGVMWPKKITVTRCVHCGNQTPVQDVRKGPGQIEDTNLGWHSARGTLDAMLALIQPIAMDGGPELPDFAMAPTSTQEERELMSQA